MRRTQLLFFSAEADLEPVMRAIEVERHLQYAKAGLQSEPTPEVYRSAFDLPSFGRAVKGDSVHEAAYLVLDADEKIEVETIPQRRGGVLYGLYPKLNPHSVTFSPGGQFDERHIIKGEVSTAGQNDAALELFRLFEREIKRTFRNVKGYRVGPAALRALDADVRLTHAVGMSPTYDLKR